MANEQEINAKVNEFCKDELASPKCREIFRKVFSQLRENNVYLIPIEESKTSITRWKDEGCTLIPLQIELCVGTYFRRCLLWNLIHEFAHLLIFDFGRDAPKIKPWWLIAPQRSAQNKEEAELLLANEEKAWNVAEEWLNRNFPLEENERDDFNSVRNLCLGSYKRQVKDFEKKNISMSNIKSDPPNSKGQGSLTMDSPTRFKWVNFVIIVVIPVISVLIAVSSIWYARQSDIRAEKVFGSQIRPLLQERPTRLIFNTSTDITLTEFEVVNYGGFDAFDITWDLKYGTSDWIVEWLRAEIHRLQQLRQRNPQEEEKLKTLSGIRLGIDKLPSGKKAVCFMAGSLRLNDVCENREGTEILFRTTWKNEKGHVFDRIRKFKLVCTRVENGISFTFLPGSIVAQDE